MTHAFIPAFLPAFIIALAAVQAQELPPIATDRPDQTETPFLVPARLFQVETGFTFERTDEDASSFSHPSMLLKYGAGANFELRLEWEWMTAETGDRRNAGILPVSIGCKIHIATEDGFIPQTAFIGHISLPDLASESFRAATYAPDFRFTMQHTLGEDVSLGYNLGAEWDGESPEPSFLYTLTAGFSLGSSIGCYAELYGFAPRKRAAEHNLDGGFTWQFARNILFDISGGIGVTSNAPEYFAGIGCSFRLME